MNIKSNILIFSVFQKHNTWSANRDAHVAAMASLKQSLVPCMELVGQYNGASELSILVEGFQYRELVEKMCKTFNQECYLESHNDRATFLVFPDGKVQAIGTLVPVSEAEAKAGGSYSYSRVADQYFVTK